MSKSFFGELPGVPEGTAFESRKALAAAGVHRPPMAGICGGAAVGAESIVVNGGYIDDQDRAMSSSTPALAAMKPRPGGRSQTSHSSTHTPTPRSSPGAEWGWRKIACHAARERFFAPTT